jgi:hypothetical protein
MSRKTACRSFCYACADSWMTSGKPERSVLAPTFFE